MATCRKRGMLRKITLVQCEVGRQLSMEENLYIFKQKPDFLVLPEYFNVDPANRNTPYNASQAEEYLKYCNALSDRFQNVVIAGTTVESAEGRFFNTSFIYNRGKNIGRYRKINPTANEKRHSISPGNDIFLMEFDGIRISVMICADVLSQSNFRALAEFEPDLIFIPTTSPFRPDETVREKFDRDQAIFVDGAGACGSYLIKCCAVGQLWDGRLQGRSLVAAPWGILSRVTPDEEDRCRILSIVLDISELREFRLKQELLLSSKSK